MRRLGVAVAVAVASSGGVGSGRPEAYLRQVVAAKLLPASRGQSSEGGRPERVRQAHVDRVWGQMSGREWAVLQDVARLRLVTGGQLERLHFAQASAASRAVVRRRVLGRLVRWRVLGTLPRRIGGVRAGSAALVYYVDTTGWRLLAAEGRKRRGVPGERYVRHVLDVAEVYVALSEQARAGAVQLVTYMAEPASWWPDGRGGTLKPDAYAVVGTMAHDDGWWLEVDRATESLPTIGRKLRAYLDFARRGEAGPDGFVPRVLVTVPDEKRRTDVVRLITQLPSPAQQLFIVTCHEDATETIMRYLNNT